MKALIILATLMLAACAQPGQIDATNTPPAVTPANPTPTAQPPTCQVYDTCTYTGGVFPQPVFNCVAKTLQADAHPEIPASFFAGESCLTYREDFHTEQSYCGPQNRFPCQVQVQGPGPEAIPALEL